MVRVQPGVSRHLALGAILASACTPVGGVVVSSIPSGRRIVRRVIACREFTASEEVAEGASAWNKGAVTVRTRAGPHSVPRGDVVAVLVHLYDEPPVVRVGQLEKLGGKGRRV